MGLRGPSSSVVEGDMQVGKMSIVDFGAKECVLTLDNE